MNGNLDENETKDFELFLNETTAPTSMRLSEKLLATRQNIQKTLVNSPKRVVQVYLLGSLFGYGFSLLFCEQNTIGLGSFAAKIAMAMCAFGMPLCWLMCGAIFSMFSVLATSFLFSKFERRYLYKNMWWLVVLTPVIASGFMIALPHALDLYGDESNQMMMLSSPTAIGWWLLGAVALPYVYEFVISLVLRQKKWNAGR